MIDIMQKRRAIEQEQLEQEQGSTPSQRQHAQQQQQSHLSARTLSNLLDERKTATSEQAIRDIAREYQFDFNVSLVLGRVASPTVALWPSPLHARAPSTRALNVTSLNRASVFPSLPGHSCSNNWLGITTRRPSLKSCHRNQSRTIPKLIWQVDRRSLQLDPKIHLSCFDYKRLTWF
jgi:hypothetical protein